MCLCAHVRVCASCLRTCKHTSQPAHTHTRPLPLCPSVPLPPYPPFPLSPYPSVPLSLWPPDSLSPYPPVPQSLCPSAPLSICGTLPWSESVNSESHSPASSFLGNSAELTRLNCNGSTVRPLGPTVRDGQSDCVSLPSPRSLHASETNGRDSPIAES